MTARKYDTNGWFEAPGNPISLVGVFPYRGASIGAPDPERIYSVYRPAEELSDEEALASFRLIPWIDEHEMLGEEFTDAQDREVLGVVGEQTWFDPTLGEFGGMRGNIKCFSEAHAQEIKDGKRELSAGYRCVYDFTPGVFNGKAYDVVQRTMRGNHLASVPDGRMGPLVAVLDHATEAEEPQTVTTRSKGRAKPRQLTADDLSRVNASPALAAAMVAALDASEDETEVEVKAEDEEVEAKAEDEEAEDGELPPALKKANEAKAEDEEVEVKAEDEEVEAKAEDAKTGMDEADFVRRLAGRNSIARDLKPVIGAFDHSEMTLDGVASYGAKKLKLKGVPAGQEALAVRMFLAGRSSVAGAARTATGLDQAETKKTPGFIARRQAK